MRFQKTAQKNDSNKNASMMSAIPMTGEALTKILRGVYSRSPEKVMVEAKKELVDNQGFEDFKTKKGEKELMAVLRGMKKFIGETNHPDGLETVPDPTCPDAD